MPVGWKVICFPTDFSEASRPAFKLGVALAEQLRARLLIAHVLELPNYAYLGPMPQSLFDQVEDEANRQLATWKADAERLGTPDAQTQLLQGLQFEAILQTARDSHADVIVMGTHGRTALRRVLIGSVAERIVRHAECPVLTVRSPDLRGDAAR